jgi:hypothetical protein
LPGGLLLKDWKFCAAAALSIGEPAENQPQRRKS